MEMVKSNNTQQLEVNLQKREMEIKEQNVFSISMDKHFISLVTIYLKCKGQVLGKVISKLLFVSHIL